MMDAKGLNFEPLILFLVKSYLKVLIIILIYSEVDTCFTDYFTHSNPSLKTFLSKSNLAKWRNLVKYSFSYEQK